MADKEIQVAGKTEAAQERGELTHEGTFFTPAVDIFETEKELVLLLDMPGVDVGKVDIDLKDDTLSIIGKVEQEPVDGRFLLHEYQVGNYFRNFHITDAIDQGKITASANAGVLRIVLPKAEKAVPRKIPISSG